MKWVIRWHCERNEERYHDTTCATRRGPFDDLNVAHRELANRWQERISKNDGKVWYVVEEMS